MRNNVRRELSGLLAAGRFSKANSLRRLVKNKRVVLYGAGGGLINFSIFVLDRYKVRPVLVLDKKFSKSTKREGVPCLSPDAYRLPEREREKTVVIVTVVRKDFHDEILASLERCGFKHIVFSTEIYENHLLCPPPELAKEGFAYYRRNRKKILDGAELFADNLSRDVYLKVLQVHLQRVPTPIPARPIEEQYFPPDVKLGKGCSRVINCGSYNGDTIRQMVRLKGRAESVVCFEPDPCNFRVLSEYLAREGRSIADSVIAFPCGVHGSNTQLRFLAGNEFNSLISDRGGALIQCVAIDQALPSFAPTLITMDVEGSEMDALRGAERTLRESRPDLAICVYHSPGHAWEVPLYLRALDLGYRFYLRNYTSFISETVLYATAGRRGR